MCARLIPPRLCAAGPPDRVRTRWFLRLRAAPRSARARRAIPPAHAAAVLPDRSPRPPPRAAATAPIRAVPGPPAPAPNPRPNPPPLPERAESPVWPPQTSCGNCQEYPNSRRRFHTRMRRGPVTARMSRKASRGYFDFTGLGGDDVHQRAALETGEDRLIDG